MMLDQPQWTRATLLDPSKTETSFSFILCDDNNMINQVLHMPCYMYSKACKMVLALTFIQHHQCEKCFLLTHTTAQCPSNCPLYKQCGYCGNSGHTMAKHKATHCCHPHPTILCDCPATCFNCRAHKLNDKGHYAFNDMCPLKKNMCCHTSAPALAPTPTPINATLTTIIPTGTTTPPPPSTV